ncbi:M20 family metallopeptidase [Haloarculaceae archaeon H-GB2-1]|nr:M20 family metallopeptidase [Haloarculaceae archaeon H-GB1-1]MEA5386858.1 M20 family metallopeptidase [Haloarculaceae archaeon H-GB11]MEA5408333.1 M20 family metallopeptidase [Haloarculaceae archaeon H-GB2-1]
MTVHIDTETVVDELRELVGRPSVNPPGDEAELMDYLVERFESSSIPYQVQTQEVKPGRSNVIARAGDPARGSLLLTGHVDVVPADGNEWQSDPFELHRDGDRLVGRGTADMKGSVAAQISAAEAYLAAADSPGEVVLAFVVDEESTGDGTKELVAEGYVDSDDVDAAILGEPTDLQLGLAHFGSVRYTVTVHGRRSHAARPERGVNAIEGLQQVLDGIGALDAEVRGADHEYLDRQSVKPTMLDGGVGGNVIPDEASVVVDWRFHPGPQNQTEFERRLRDSFGSVTVSGTEVDVDIDLWQFTRGAEVDADEAVVRAVEQSARDLDYTCAPIGCNYGADTPHLIYGGNIPTVLFGPGSIDDAHSIDESIRESDLVAAAEIYARTLERFLN